MGGIRTFGQVSLVKPVIWTRSPRFNPVFLTDTSLHSAWVNSKALELAHIDSSTPDPAGGIIQRDERGNPTGILFEKAVALVESIIPPAQPEERRRNLLPKPRID